MQKTDGLLIPVLDNEEINLFFEENDISLYMPEKLSDLNFFYNVFPEIILSLEEKVVSLKSKEAAYIRVIVIVIADSICPDGYFYFYFLNNVSMSIR